jgi:hypothetical protein
VRRILSFALGLGIGLVIGGNVVRRLDAVQQRFAPDRIGVAASAFVDRTRVRVVDGVGARMRPARRWRSPGGDGAAWTR